MLRVRVDAALGITLRKRVPEQRRALRFGEALSLAPQAIQSIAQAYLLGGDAHKVALAPRLGSTALCKGEHEHVLGEDALLLHARRGEVDEGAGVSSSTRKWAGCAGPAVRMPTRSRLVRKKTHPWRMLMPPPVPVTQPSL